MPARLRSPKPTMMNFNPHSRMRLRMLRLIRPLMRKVPMPLLKTLSLNCGFSR